MVSVNTEKSEEEPLTIFLCPVHIYLYIAQWWAVRAAMRECVFHTGYPTTAVVCASNTLLFSVSSVGTPEESWRTSCMFSLFNLCLALLSVRHTISSVVNVWCHAVAVPYSYRL